MVKVTESLKRFLDDPVRSGSDWKVLSEPLVENRLVRELDSFVKGENSAFGLPPGLVLLLPALERPGFEKAIDAYFQSRRILEVDAARLAKNAVGLIWTAFAAAACRHAAAISSTGASYRNEAKRLVKAAALTVRGGPLAERSEFATGDERSALWWIETLFREVEREGGPSRTGLYWTLWWLDKNDLLGSGHGCETRIVSISQTSGNPRLHRFHIQRLHDGPGDSLVESPEIALAPLGRDFVQTVGEAWSSAGRPPVCWHVNGADVPLSGCSHGGAAAVAFRNVAIRGDLLQSSLVLAELSEGGELRPVKHQRDKALLACANDVRTVVLARTEGSDAASMKPDDIAAVEAAGAKVAFASNVGEAYDAASGVGFYGVPELGVQLLRKYTLVKQLAGSSRGTVHLGTDDDQAGFLIRTWPVDTGAAAQFGRALWDRELRNIYLLSSSARAEQALMVMKDAGVDRRAQRFVLVMHAPGYFRLADALKERAKFPWLQADSQRNPSARRNVWEGLHRIAEGLSIIHRRHLVHRCVTPESVFFDVSGGPDTWRLGGFEWTVRLGAALAGAGAQGNWHLRPEPEADSRETVALEDDWFAFGMLAARCFLRLEEIGHLRASEINRRLHQILEGNAGSLVGPEVDFIRQLTHPDRAARPILAFEILRSLDFVIEAVRALEVPNEARRGSLLLTFIPADLGPLANEAGFQPIPSEAQRQAGIQEVQFSPTDVEHVRQLREFLVRDFEKRFLYTMPESRQGQDEYILAGRKLCLRIGPFQRFGEITTTWDVAMARGPFTLRNGKHYSDISDVPILFVPLKELQRERATCSWQQYLPGRRRNALDQELDKFWKVLRFTNQLELIMRWTELFSYRLDPEYSPRAEGLASERIRIIPHAQKREIEFLKRNEGGMVEFFSREMEQHGGGLVFLTEEDVMRWSPGTPKEKWEIKEIVDGGIVLERIRERSLPSPPARGFIRSAGFHGQIRLIERRKEAIDRLEDHRYLLRALATPNYAFFDTQESELPFASPPDVIDESKEAVMRDVLRTRPLYALQGPPGTGKTHLVSYLIRQILEEDPVAQMLVTAQAHGAVDVLRQKVEGEAFGDQKNKPIMVRLGLTSSKGEEDPASVSGTVENKALEVLKRVGTELDGLPALTEVQRQWRDFVTNLTSAGGAVESQLAEFRELVRRGASIVFCTTSASDLEDLAKGDHFFDWTVIEEAGKVHGYDLALPMQAGHRWLLLGDHYQLPPYRLEDFQTGIKCADQVAEILDAVSGADRLLVDNDWLREWAALSQEGKEEFKKNAEDWVEPFKRIFNNAIVNHGLTTTKSVGAYAGMLSKQYRMNPVIGSLISNVFYKGEVRNAVEASARAHGFGEPVALDGKALAWIDVPWCKADFRCKEDASPRFTNPVEVEAIKSFLKRLKWRDGRPPELPQTIAVLSPYSRQSKQLQDELEREVKLGDLRLPDGLSFRKNLRFRLKAERTAHTHTVDSFQGNQADVVIISLTRNNDYPRRAEKERRPGEERTPEALGFLANPERLNVLFSRAERLMVLVGSWDFFRHHVEGVSLLTGPEEPLLHWKMIMDELTKLEKDGRLWRMPFRPARERS